MGTAKPEMLNPLPLAAALEIEIDEDPVFVITSVADCVLPTTTFENVKAPGLPTRVLAVVPVP
jgi:hypothetical protein